MDTVAGGGRRGRSPPAESVFQDHIFSGVNQLITSRGRVLVVSHGSCQSAERDDKKEQLYYVISRGLKLFLEAFRAITMKKSDSCLLRQ